MTGKTQLTLCALLAAAALLPACAARPTAPQPDQIPVNTRQGFSMQVLPESFSQGGSGRFHMDVIDQGERTELRIIADEANELSHFYVVLSYDGSRWHPLDAAPGPLMEGQGELLHLLASAGEGRAQYGQLIAGMDPPGAGGSGLLATVEFRHAADTATPRAASAALQAAPALSRNGRWDILSWYYLNTGDYDQNGVVNISDLTPLGINIHTSGPFAEDSAQWIVDGDGNGEINLADITPIGVNFGNTIDGYIIYAGEDGAGYPADPQDDNGPQTRSVASLDFSEALGGAGERKHFSYTDSTVQLHERYWLRTQAAGAESPTSNLTETWLKDWDRSVAFSTIKKPDGGAPRLAVVAGRPCALYVGGNDVDGAALFMRADDAIGGGSWSLPVNVSSPQIETGFLELMEYDGRPAIAFGSELTGATVFRQAADAEGSSWLDPLTVSATGYFPQDMFLFEGRPAILGCDGALSLLYVLSEDESFFPGYGLLASSDCSAVPRSSAVELCYRSGISSYHALLDFDGFSFSESSNTQIAMDFNLDECTDTFDYGGKLNMLLFDDLLHRYEFVQGAGGDSGIFTAPLGILETGVEAAVQCESLGRIWMAYVNIDVGTVRCRMSGEGDLSSMSQLPDLDSLTSEKFHPAIAEVRRHPAVLYVNETAAPFEFILARYI